MATSFADYLSQTTESFQSTYPNYFSSGFTYHVIIGNEAGDCDSIVSALALAYTQSLVDQDKSMSDGSKVYLPVCSIERDDMALRRETVLLLKKCGVDPDSLLYLDDVSVCYLLSEDSDNVQVELTLTDHNKIRSSLQHLSNNVKQIVDHHADDGAHKHVVSEVREIAFHSDSNKALVGSTCTLVAERLTKVTSSLETDCEIDSGVASALLGTIVIDTMNMSASAGKGTKRDGNMINVLMGSAGWSKDCRAPNLEKLYEWLNSAKFDCTFWDEMSVRDCLRIDYKRFQSSDSGNAFGISSVLLPIDKLISKSDNFLESAKMFIKDGNIELLGIMSMVIEEGNPRREMLLIGDKCKVKTMTDFLTKHNYASFLKISISDSDNDSDTSSDLTSRILSQGNIKGSRKQVAPAMMKCRL